MSITVVVTRDYDDVPSCFEKYERGTRWRVNSGNLEIFVERTLVALYPSGNWVSVYVDDAMLLHKGGDKPDYSSMPTADAARPARSALRPDAGRSSAPVERAGAEILRADGTPWLPADDTDFGVDDDPPTAPATFFPDEDDVVAARASMQTLSFRPKRYRGTPPPAKKAPTGPRLLPIKFRMRKYKEPAAADPATTATPGDRPRMMPVTMRTTIYRAARATPAEPPGEAPDHRSEGAPETD